MYFSFYFLHIFLLFPTISYCCLLCFLIANMSISFGYSQWNILSATFLLPELIVTLMKLGSEGSWFQLFLTAVLSLYALLYVLTRTVISSPIAIIYSKWKIFRIFVCYWKIRWFDSYLFEDMFLFHTRLTRTVCACYHYFVCIYRRFRSNHNRFRSLIC